MKAQVLANRPVNYILVMVAVSKNSTIKFKQQQLCRPVEYQAFKKWTNFARTPGSI